MFAIDRHLIVALVQDSFEFIWTVLILVLEIWHSGFFIDEKWEIREANKFLLECCRFNCEEREVKNR